MRAFALLLLAASLPAWHAAQSTQPSAAPAATDCYVFLEGRGNKEGSLQDQIGVAKAVLNCTGMDGAIAVNGVVLQALSSRDRGAVTACNSSQTAPLGPDSCLLTVCGTSRVRIAGTIRHLRFDSSSSPITHALCVLGSAVVTVHDSVITENSLSAVAVTDVARLVLKASRVIQNYGKGYAGGVTAIGSSTAAVVDSLVQGNEMFNMQIRPGVVIGPGPVSGPSLGPVRRAPLEPFVATTGAGLHVGGTAHVMLSNSTILTNRCDLCCGGGLGVAGQGILIVANGSVVNNNAASIGGGGACVQGNSSLVVMGSSSISSNRADDAGGGVLVSGSSSVTITGASLISNNTCIIGGETIGSGRGGGAVCVKDSARLLLSKHARLVDNWASKGSGGGVLSSNMSSLTITAGVEFAGNRVDDGHLGPDIAMFDRVLLDIHHGVRYQSGELSKCSDTVYLGRAPCGAGEYIVSDACMCCPVYTYGFEPNMTECRQCPSNAFCRADSVLPAVGHWHSSPRSVQMHKCPLGAASCGANGTCLGGHTGNLCGACREGYGLWLPLRCSKCLPAPQQLAVYLVLFFGCVGLVAYTVHATLRDNQAGGRDLRPSDLLKVLAQFLQYLVILGSISVPWPAFLSCCFVAATVVFGAASGQSSLDCWLQQTGAGMRLPLAVQRQLVPFLATVAVLVAVVLLLLGLHWLKRLSRVRARNRVRGGWRMPAPKPLQALQRLRVSMLVVAFFAYPTLVKAALSYFACLPVDVAGKQPYPEYAAATHPYGYWVSDIQQECFAGWHKPWALGLGLPAAVVLCVGVPAVLLWFLVVNKHRTSDACFQELYGFLYRNYTDTSRWWEAVWALQTVALTAVSVFHFTLKAYYALLLMGLVLLLSAAVQQAAKPYRHRQLHRLHMAGTCCLYLNTWLALNLFTFEMEGPSLTALHTAVGAIVVAMDAAFVACCVYSILGVAHPGVQAALLKGAEWAKSRALLLPCCVSGSYG